MPLTTDTKEMPVRIVGSSVYGAYPTVSAERTYNMYITNSGDGSEEWLINFPGYKEILKLTENGSEGRGAFHSIRGNFLICVVAADVFRIDVLNSVPTLLGTIGTSTGEVFIDENLSSQICIVDGLVAYIYNYEEAPSVIAPAVYNNIPAGTSFLPNYVSYQNTYFLIGNALTDNFGSQWVVLKTGTDGTLGNAYDLDWVQTLSLQTKPDFAKAVLRIPGKGNNVIVFGTSVCEIWSNTGGFAVYQRNSSVNIDYGIASVSTIAANDEIVAWLGINEKSSPAIMAMKGGSASRISTDGLDKLLENVNFPSDSTAIFYRQSGHLFYILSFTNPADNFSILYDFTLKKLYDITDWDFSTFPARQIVYFNNKNYFISYKTGSLYEISLNYTTYDVLNDEDTSNYTSYDIPCVRLTNTFRISDRPEKLKIKLFTFVIESGTTEDAYDFPVCNGYILNEETDGIIYTEDGSPLLVENGYCSTNKPRVDLRISKNGGITFSNIVSYDLKRTGNFKNQPRFNNLGYAQQITYQMRFWGNGRKVVKNGTMEVGR